MSVLPGSTERPAPGDKVGRADLAVRALKRLAAAYQAIRLYRADASTREPIRQCIELLTRYTERYGPLTGRVTRSSFILDAERTELKDDLIAPLAQSLHSRLIQRVSLLPGVSAADLQHLLATLTTSREAVLRAGGVDRMLAARGVTRVALEVTPVPAGSGTPAGEAQAGALMQAGRQAPDDPGAPERSASRREAASAILRLFVAASKNTRLYPSGHPGVATAVETLSAAMAPVLAGLGSLQYSVRDGGAVFCNQELLDTEPLVVEEFAAACTTRKIASLTFRGGVTREELAHAVSLFGREPEMLIVEGGFSGALEAQKVTHVSAGPLEAAGGMP